jgi:acetylornithine deacetylase/succinyl-diaminopimelate desuccinylase-like protein
VGTRATGWKGDPFSGAIEGGEVIGRGALDAKGLTVVHVLALEALSRRRVALERDVILLAVPDEETGGRLGLGWLLRKYPKLLGGARYALTEGGSIRTGAGRDPLWSVTVAEKSPCWLELRTHGTPGHAGTPTPDAAVPRLIAALERVRTAEWPLHVVPEVERMFRSLADSAPPRDRRAYLDLERALEGDPDFRRRFLRHRANAALVRNTVSITVLQGAPHTNVVPAEARAQLDARLLPGERCEDFARQIRVLVADPAVAIERILSHPATRSPIDTALYRAIERLAARFDSGAKVIARISTGSSDAHWLRDRGVVTYGFIPRWLAPGDTRGIHGPDERISIENLERGPLALVQLLEVLDEID